MGDDTEWLKLPTDEKCVHKVWKARLAGYEEAVKLFPTLDEKSPEFSKYLGIIKKFVVDNNAIAQEKALDAVLSYVENAAVAGRTTGEVCNGIITKCLNASRAKTKERGMEILMMYIEIEKQEIVNEELLKGLTNKQPKVVAGCVQCLRTALRDFGSKVVPIKPMVKQIQKLLEDRDKIVREEGKQLVIEIYRWIGAALRPQLANLKPVQVTELEAEFDNIKPASARQCRFLRSQQDLKAKMEEQAAAGDGGEQAAGADGGEAPEEIDPYELMSAVDILSKIPKDYYDKIEAKKWQERKEALEAVQRLSENPKLEPGDYHDLVKTLKKVVAKDTNVMLVTIAAKCLGNLAKGLRKKFSSYAVGTTEALLEKFKEKKVTVVAALKEAIDAVFLTTTLEAISENVLESLGHKTPSVKAETAAFIARCFSMCTPSNLPKKQLKLYVTALLKTINDTTPEVREASYSALGTAMKVVGEKPITPFLADIDPLKLAKVKEYCEKTILLNRNGQPRGGAPAAAAATTAAPATSAPAKKVIKGGPPPRSESTSGTDSAKPPNGAKPKTGGPPKAGAKKGAAKGKKPAAAEKEEKVEPHLADEVVEEKASLLLPADSVTGLASANWKERLAAIEKLTDAVKLMSRAELPVQVCVRVIVKKPGLKENNFQVLKLKVELLAHMAAHGDFTKTSASYCLADLVDKVGDAKSGSAVQTALSNIAEATALDFIANEVIAHAFTQKNPKNQSESLNWLASALKDFGFKIQVKPTVECVKKALAATNPAIRTAAISVLSVMYMFMGQPLRMLFDGEKAALLQQIDAEFEKVKGEKPPAPTRGVKSAASAGGGGEAEEEDEEEGGAQDAVNVADLVPRNDISNELTPELMTELADKNWKVRNEALQKVVSILNEAKFITANIGPLPESLKLRLGDSNKILAQAALNICQTLATAMGPNIKQHIRIIGPGIVGCLGDSKPHIRANAVSALNAWIEQTGTPGFVQFVEAEIFADALKTENPNLRTELLGWLAGKLPSYNKLPAELNTCTPYLFVCLEDRNGEVRKKAHEAVIPFMTLLGYESMARQASKLKPASKDQVMGILEKARPNLPQKPVKAAKAKPATPAARAPSPAPPSIPSPDSESDESERPTTASAKTSTAAKGKGKPSGLKKPGATPVASRKKNAQEEDVGPPLKVVNRGKEQRVKDEKALKTLKWNFTVPRGEYIDQLKQQMEPGFSKTLIDQLFHSDFKNHLKAIETLQKVVDEGDSTIANLDLILKWATIRFFDTNTSVLMKVLDYVQCLFRMLATKDYHLMEQEATSFVPYLVNKVGDPKDNVRRMVREIFKLVYQVFPASKMFSYVIEGLKSKNSKQRTECLEELGALIEVYGINVCQPSPAQALKLIAQQISDRDNSVRSSALNTIVSAHCILGDTVHKYIGHLSDKDAGMLEERIKRSARTKAQSQPPPSRASPEEKPKEKPRTQRTAVVPQENQTEPTSRPMKPNRSSYLELEDETSMEPYEMPKFIDHGNLDMLYEPVSLPETKTSKLRPPSPSAKLVQSSTNAKTAVDLIISQVASNDIDTSIQALAQIDSLLKNADKCEVMESHTDQFLVTCTVQLRMVYSKHMSDPSLNVQAVVSLYKCLLASMLMLFECQALAKVTSRDVLRDLIHNLITILLDSRLNDMEEGKQIIRTLNILVVKIVAKANATSIMSALIKLLHQTVEAETSSPKYLELVMKGLWKMVRMLPEIIDDMDVSKIIQDLDKFLKAFPGYTWKQRTNELPMRTVKTILHSLAKLKGTKIMSHLDLIEHVDGQTAEIESYLRRILKSGVDGSSTPKEQNAAKVQRQNEINGSQESVELRKDRKDNAKSKRLSKSTHDMLAEIFKKIGSKENTREGLSDLYDFKQRYPEADLDPFLKKSSQFFQSYVERGLKNIQIEREGKMKSSASAPNMSMDTGLSLASDSQQSSADDLSASVYRERLKILRARWGFDNSESDPNLGANTEIFKARSNQQDGQGSSSSLSSSSSTGKLSCISSSTLENAQEINSSENVPVEKEPVSMNVTDLKKRLQKIKKAAHNVN